MKTWHTKQLGATSKKVCNMQAITRSYACQDDIALLYGQLNSHCHDLGHNLIYCIRDEGCGEQRLWLEIPEQLMHLRSIENFRK